MRFLYAFLLTFSILNAESSLVREFELYKLNENNKLAPTLLLMGGIHGDEPGAYFATDVFLRHYKITKGSVWVVPIVNPHGMFANMRGIYGDMNRKFAYIDTNDPDKKSIDSIKSLLADPNIDISLHLHDGSGYWRDKYINNLLNPYRWGNCTVIDQPSLDGHKFGNLQSYAMQIVADINQFVQNATQTYHLHNTNTKKQNDKEQLRALTFYSLSINKPALTNEASKEIALPLRVYYHLLAIESLLGQLGIEFQRDFELSEKNIAKLINLENFTLNIEGKITLPLQDLKESISHFPLPQDKDVKLLKLDSQTKLTGIVKDSTTLRLKYGHKNLSVLQPFFTTYSKQVPDSISIIADGKAQSIKIGTMVHIADSIQFSNLPNHRINVIGYIKPNDNAKMPNETEITIRKKDILSSYSLDKNANVYRAEVYRQENATKEEFAGMITFSFDKPIAESERVFKDIAYKPAKDIKTPQIAKNDIKDLKKTIEKPQDLAQNKVQDSHPKKPESSKNSNKKLDEKDKNQKTIKETKTLKNQKTSPAFEKVFIKAQNGVNVRNAPSLQGSIIYKLPYAFKLEKLESSDKWSKVTYTNTNGAKQVGYVISSALSTEEINNEPTLQITQNLKDSKNLQSKNELQAQAKLDSTIKAHSHKINARVKVPTALVRSRPSVESSIIAKAPLNREVEILENLGEWSHIYYIFQNKKIIDGYIATRLLEKL